jgi:acyl-CoA synthetase (AMP-forming)/AMP-acid ligase II
MVTDATVATLWQSVVARVPDGVAVHDVDETGHRTITFGALYQRIRAFAAMLRDLGLDSGDRVAIVSSGFERGHIEAEQGLMVGGFVRVSLDPSTHPTELRAQLEHAGVRAITFEPQYFDLVDAIRTGSEVLIGLGSQETEAVMKSAPNANMVNPSPLDLASLNYTGGTTGRPKAVAITHRGYASVIQAVNSSRLLADDDLFLNVRPMWPISGIIVAIHLLAGSPVVMGRRFDTQSFTTQVEHWRATRTSLVPTMLVRLLENPQQRFDSLASLRCVDIGAAGVPGSLMREAVDRIGPVFGAVYGLTEAPWTCYRPPADLLRADGSITTSVGRPVGDHSVWIDDEEGAVGEVMIAGDHLMTGYWNDPEASAMAMKGGAIRTGDLGRIDADGSLHITGRLKEQIRTGGRSVEPREVEAVIRNIPGVKDVTIIGLPDEKWGEQVAAVIVRQTSTITAEVVDAACRVSLTAHKRPRTIRFVTSIPRSHYGKPLLNEVLTLFDDRAES